MKLIKFLVFIAIFIASISINNAQEAKINQVAPEFNLPDSYGNTHKLSDFKGKYIVLEWINFDCPFVVKHYESQNMQKLQQEYTEKEVVWLSICSSAEGKQGNFKNEEINRRIEEHKAMMTAYLIDESGEVGKNYGAKTTPHIYIINPEGILIYAGGIDDIKSTDQNDIPKAKNYVKSTLDEAMNGRDISKQTSSPYGCSVKYK